MPSRLRAVLGTDALRYYLLRDVSFGQDGNFSHDALLTRYNSDLANGLGNLASRTLTMIERYCGGEVIAPHSAHVGEAEKSLAEALVAAAHATVEQYEELSFSRALETIWAAVAQVDGYMTAQKPWTLADDPAAAWASGDGAVPRGRSAADYCGAGASVLAECDGEDLGAAWAVGTAGGVANRSAYAWRAAGWDADWGIGAGVPARRT